MALGVGQVKVGCWTSPLGPSGCTVILPPAGTLGAVAVRGAAPGTREAAALGPAGKLTVCHAVVLAGGSAFGLAAADGVMRWLEERGIGYPTRGGAIVPIVGAAIVLDQGVGLPAARPGAEAGYAACEAASEDEPPEGSVGAGTGCAVAKVGGHEYAWRGGQGVAVRQACGVTVGAIVVNNAVGEVVDEHGTWLASSRAPADRPRFPATLEPLIPASPGGGGSLRGPGDSAAGGGGSLRGPGDSAAGGGGSLRGPGDSAAGGGGAPPVARGLTESTIIGCVATDARLSKGEAVRVADLAHSGVARAVRPAHTSMDGDALFCLATQQITTHLDLVAALAADAVAEACRRAVLTAVTRDGLPGLASEAAAR